MWRIPVKIRALSAMQFSSVLRTESFFLGTNLVKDVAILIVVSVYLLCVKNVRVLVLLMTESDVNVFGQTE
jgi:hypothetical protein